MMIPDCEYRRGLDVWLSSCFSLEVDRQSGPWVFDKGDRPSLIMSTLEALAVLVALQLYFGERSGTHQT